MNIDMFKANLPPMIKEFFKAMYFGDKFLHENTIDGTNFKFSGDVRPQIVKKIFGEKFKPNLHENSVVLDSSKQRCERGEYNLELMYYFEALEDLKKVVLLEKEDDILIWTLMDVADEVSAVLDAAESMKLSGRVYNSSEMESPITRMAINLKISIAGWQSMTAGDA